MVSTVERDPRCRMITLDPETAEPSPGILGKVARAYGGTAGVYDAILAERTVRQGGDIELLSSGHQPARAT